MATLAADRPSLAARALPGFDYLVVAASAWLLGGLYWDGWAHGFGLADSFWTIWHAAFYSGYVAFALVLFTAIARARHASSSWREAIPAGYELATFGAIVFAFGGAFDATWHTLFGIETSTDALLSPSHLMLGTGIALMVSGPLVATSHRRRHGGLLTQLPAVLSLTALLCVFTFFSLFAGPYSGVLGQGPRPSDAILVRTLLGMYLFSALIVGLSLVGIRRGTLPPGALTVMLGINAIAMIVARGHAPFEVQVTFMGVAIAAGIAGDLLVRRLRPGPDRIVATRIFAFALPVVFFGLYFAAVIVGVGSGWTVHALTGSVLLSGIVGLLLSFVFVGANAPEPDR